MNYKFSEADVPSRVYPSNKVRGDTRYVLIRGNHISFPKLYHYHQYLVIVLFPVAIGSQILTDKNDESAFHRLIMNHIRKFVSGPQYMPTRGSNADTYLLVTANDIELLFTNELLDDQLLKRLRSKSDGEMRGVIYEIAIAAAFLRDGYSIKWLKGDALPEFTATRDIKIDVEAKRRNRTGRKNYDLEQEIRAIRSNLAKALKKKRQNPYLIFIDSDIPPLTSKENDVFYKRCEQEFKDYNLENTAVIITNSGYENDEDALETGKNSTMVFQGKNGPSEDLVKAIVLSLHAKLPESISSDWPVA